MKKQGILNAQMNRILASLGHTDLLVIGDCGLPIPAGVERVDLVSHAGLIAKTCSHARHTFQAERV